jgi:hypothetical protein
VEDVKRGSALKLYVLFEKLGMLISRNRRVDGLWVGVLGDKKDDYLLQRVEDALKLIQQYDPTRYRRILRDVDRIWISHLIGARGQFNDTLKTCELDYKFVSSSPPELVASIIVHEATHAHPYLRKLGYPEELRYRIEKICIKQQLAFAQKHPNGNEAVKRAEQLLALDQSFWSNEEFRERRPNQELAAATDAGIPHWLVRLIWKLRRKPKRK